MKLRGCLPNCEISATMDHFPATDFELTQETVSALWFPFRTVLEYC